MKIIGLLGAKGSGKTTASDILVQKYGAKKYAFADPLKDIAKRVFEFTDDQLWGTQAAKEAVDERYGFSPRWLLQKLGTEGIREVFGPDIWWKTCLRRIMEDKPELAVIEDFRFLNEVEGFLQINGSVTNADEAPVAIWRMQPPDDHPGIMADDHQSEIEWKKAPYTHLIAPAKYGLIQLFDAIEAAVDECNIPKKALVMP